MKKSAHYKAAMKAVLKSDFSDELKLEILETLMADKSSAEWSEGREVKENEAV